MWWGLEGHPFLWYLSLLFSPLILTKFAVLIVFCSLSPHVLFLLSGAHRDRCPKKFNAPSRCCALVVIQHLSVCFFCACTWSNSFHLDKHNSCCGALFDMLSNAVMFTCISLFSLQLSYKQQEESNPDHHISHATPPTLPSSPPWTPGYIRLVYWNANTLLLYLHNYF